MDIVKISFWKLLNGGGNIVSNNTDTVNKGLTSFLQFGRID